MAESLDCVVVGAGVVGLAVGRALAAEGRDVVVLEAESAIGTHASSRNSEVIHAGIYYPAASLKARLCVDGKQQLYDYCRNRGVPHRRIGKLIVATNPAQIVKLEQLVDQGRRNGVDGLKLMSKDEAGQLEPNVDCLAAAFSATTGIIDSHAYMLALQGDLEAEGGIVILNSRVSSVEIGSEGFAFSVGGVSYRCRTVVNAAGLWAQDIVEEKLSPSSRRTIATTLYAKGHYFTYPGKSPFRHLVYPLPTDGGLGIHATNDMGGSVRFGPDVTWVEDIDYSFDESCKPRFEAAIRQYFPALDPAKLLPGYTGIRAKLAGPADPPSDFLIQSERDHGIPGLVNLFGIESPGLTASLAIGDYVAAALR